MQKFYFFILVSLFSHVFGKSKSDFEIWNYDRFFGFINDHQWIFAETAIKFNDDASRFYFFYEHLQMTWKPSSFFTIAPAYRQEFIRDPTNSNWITMYSPNLNAAFLWNTAHVHFRDRSRISYGVLSDHSFRGWIYRNKLSLRTRKRFTSIKIRFFGENEIFITEGQGLDEYRLTAKSLMRLTKKINFEIGYRFVSEKRLHSWFNKNVLLLSFEGNF